MDRRTFFKRAGTAISAMQLKDLLLPTRARALARAQQGIYTLDANIQGLETGQPVSYTPEFLTADEFNKRYGNDYSIQGTRIPGQRITEPDKVGVVISPPGYVPYITAGYLDQDTGIVTLRNAYGDPLRVLMPTANKVLMEFCDVHRKSRDVFGLIKHPDLREVDFQIQASTPGLPQTSQPVKIYSADSPEVKRLEDILIEVTGLATNGYFKLSRDAIKKNPNLTKPTKLEDYPADSFWVFMYPGNQETGDLRKNSKGLASQVNLSYIDNSPGSLKPAYAEPLSGLGFKEPGMETGTLDLETAIANMGGSIFNDLKGATYPMTPMDRLVILFHATRPLGNTKIPINERFPTNYDIDQGHVLLPSQRPLIGDFNGDGGVDFEDFFKFAEVFGTRKGRHQEYNPLFDLDGDGEIGFNDFFLFAAGFGKKRA